MLKTEFKGHIELKGKDAAWGPGDIAEVMTCGSPQEEKAEGDFCVLFKATAFTVGEYSEVEVY